MRNASTLLFAGVLILASWGLASAEDEDSIRVLILSGRNNHDWKATTPVLKQMYEDSERFVADVMEEPGKLTAEMLSKYDVIVSNWCAWPEVTGRQWGASAEKAFVDFVRGGGGFALLHAASATFHDWPEFQQMAGATWDLGKTGHGAIHAFKVSIKDSDHPVTRGMPDFMIRDELWHQMGRQQDIQVICEAFSSKDSGGSGQSEPVVICTKFGQGRCFYNILGHDAETMKNVAWRTLMLRGTQWAATGKVTVPIQDDWPAAKAPSESESMISSGLGWKQTDSSLALMNGQRIVWRFNFDKKLSRPYFHPVCLVDGTELTWDSPPDHPWHHGFWFAWKYINGLNYWEEDGQTGLSQGLTELQNVHIEPHDDFSATIYVRLGYHPPDKPSILRESRLINVSTPDEQNRYRITWASTFEAGDQDVLLDRTPIPGEKDGVSWGGYAGLSVRIAKGVTDWQVVDSEGHKGLEGHGKSARWMDFTGRTEAGKELGIAIFDHPDNLRHPSPWFVIADPGAPFGYFSPGLLFKEPLTLSKGKTLTLRYGLLVHPGRADKELLEGEWKRFATMRRRAAMHKRLLGDEYVGEVRGDVLSSRGILDAMRETLGPGESGQWNSEGEGRSLLDSVKVESGGGAEAEFNVLPEVRRERASMRVRADSTVSDRVANRGRGDLSQLTPETTFGEALDILRNATYPPLNMIVYWKDLEDNAGIDRETPIEMQGVSGIPVRSALNLLLRAVSGGFAELGYTVQDGVIIIATKDSLPVRWETRVYDIRDLYHDPYSTRFPFGFGGFGSFGGFSNFGSFGNNSGYQGGVGNNRGY